MDFNVQLRNLREKVAAETDDLHKLVAEAEKQNRGLNDDERARYEAGEKAIAEARGRIDIMERQAKIGPHSERVNDTKLDPKDQKRYSLSKAILAMSMPGDRRAQDAAGFEREVSEEIATRTGRPARGIYVPRSVFAGERRTMVTTVGSSAGYLVAEELMADEFIGMLRASIVAASGATRMSGLVGDVLIPKQTAAGTHYWLATEEAEATETAGTFGQVRLSPKHGAAHTRYSRQTLVQSTPGVEGIVRNDLQRIYALAVDRAALYGSGDGGEPLGLKNTTNVNDPTNFSAATPTWAELMAMVGACALDNAIGQGGSEDGRAPGTVSWIVEGEMYSNLMAKSKDTGSGTFCLEDGRIGPWSAGLSNNIVTGDVWFGDWSQLLVATWGDPDLIVNPYTSDTSGTIRLTLHHFTDTACRHPQAFCFNNDG